MKFPLYLRLLSARLVEQLAFDEGRNLCLLQLFFINGPRGGHLNRRAAS